MAAFNARDLEAYLALADPHIVLHSVFAAIGGATYNGHEGVTDWFNDLAEAWGDDVRFEVNAYFDFGARTVAAGDLRGRGRQSGAEVAITGFQVVTWGNGLIIHYKAYPEKETLLRELGISEEDLTPGGPEAWRM